MHKLMIVDENPLNKISIRIINKALNEAKIPKNKVYLASLNKCDNQSTSQRLLLEEIDKVKPIVVIAMGKKVVYSLLLHILKNEHFNLSQHIGKVYNCHNTKIIPSYDSNWIMNHGKKEWKSLQDCLQLARNVIFK